MMKILIVGAGAPFSLETYYAEGLRGLGADVRIVPIRGLLGDYYNRTTFNKVKFRLKLSSIYRKLNKILLTVFEEMRPDVVWVFKGMEVFPRTLQQLKHAGALMVNFNPDHPFIFSAYGSGNRNVTLGLKEYNLHFCFAQLVARRISHETGSKVIRLPFGYSLTDEEFHKVEAGEEQKRVCFVGICDGERFARIEYLRDQGIPVDLYGKGWRNWINESEDLRIFDPVYNEDYWRVLRSYRVQLNMLRPHNQGNHNMRTFEVPAAGGIMLTEKSEEQIEFFEDGAEIFCYENNEEMVRRAREILSLSKEAASAIRQRARERSLADGHSYRERAKVVFSTLQDVLAS